MSRPGGALQVAGSLSLTALVAVCVRTQFGAPMVVGSDAMAPALRRGDVVWVDRGGGSALRAGAVVAYRPTVGAGLTMKRVVAGPGQVVEFASGRLVLDGVPRGTATEEAWCGQPVVVRPGTDAAAVTVPRGAAYLLGDDRRVSGDSRQWGPVDASTVVGRVRLVLWGAGGTSAVPACDATVM